MKAKKVLAGALTCAMMLTMGMTAFAADGNVDGGMKKVYKLTNEGTESPAETFHFTATFASVTDAADGVTTGPALTIADATYAKGEAIVAGADKILAITHAEAFPSVGIYTYKVTETAGTTAGVTYDTSVKTLVVTVTQQEDGSLKETYALHNGADAKADKTDTVENEYSAGTLKVTKEVKGNLGDKSKKFNFTVKFTKPAEKEVNSTITASVAGSDVTFNPVWEEDGSYTYTFQLANGETASFKNIPYGVTYEVTEENQEYESTVTGKASDTINAAEQSVKFTNTKAGEVDTGINLTTLPYMLTIAGIVVIAAIAFVAKRRRFED